MDLPDRILDALIALKDDDKKQAMARRIVLNESHFNLGVIKVIETKCVSAKPADRNKLIRRLRTGSRTAHDLLVVDKGAVSAIKDRILDWINGAGPRSEADFADWTDSEVYHFCLNKIEVLQAIVESELESEDRLMIARRLANIRTGLIALVRKLSA
jgi:hypothetical protein